MKHCLSWCRVSCHLPLVPRSTWIWTDLKPVEALRLLRCPDLKSLLCLLLDSTVIERRHSERERLGGRVSGFRSNWRSCPPPSQPPCVWLLCYTAGSLVRCGSAEKLPLSPRTQRGNKRVSFVQVQTRVLTVCMCTLTLHKSLTQIPLLTKNFSPYVGEFAFSLHPSSTRRSEVSPHHTTAGPWVPHLDWSALQG